MAVSHIGDTARVQRELDGVTDRAVVHGVHRREDRRPVVPPGGVVAPGDADARAAVGVGAGDVRAGLTERDHGLLHGEGVAERVAYVEVVLVVDAMRAGRRLDQGAAHVAVLVEHRHGVVADQLLAHAADLGL